MIIQPRIHLQSLHATAVAKGSNVVRHGDGSGDTRGGTAAAGQGGVAVSTTAATATSGNGDFDRVKVEKIGAAIAAGTLRVDPAAIADGLIADVKALISHGLV